MEAQHALQDLDRERVLAERDLAVGDWLRARRRVRDTLGSLVEHARPLEPGLSAWLHLLGALARLDQAAASDGQLLLWPELGAARASAGRDQRADMPAEPLAAQRRGAERLPGTSAMQVISRDARLLHTLAFLEQLAPTDLPVLLEGETGTGKEVVARGVHGVSRRSARAFVAVNCGALPGELHESELFGHARGAFTGALTEKPGLFEAAHEGTLFLDEIGEMDPRAQVKLLRVLESGELRRLGEVRTRLVDVRVVAATNHDVDQAVSCGRFRRDLLFRLGAVRVKLPPLRERRSDILPLAMHFLRQAAVRTPPLTPAARQVLVRHDWPGNVRELKWVMERAAVLWARSDRPQLTAECLMLPPAPREAVGHPAPTPGVTPGSLPPGHTLDTWLNEIERRLIGDALAQSGGNRTLAARSLGGVSRTTLIGRMKRLGLFTTKRGGRGPGA